MAGVTGDPNKIKQQWGGEGALLLKTSKKKRKLNRISAVRPSESDNEFLRIGDTKREVEGRLRGKKKKKEKKPLGKGEKVEEPTSFEPRWTTALRNRRRGTKKNGVLGKGEKEQKGREQRKRGKCAEFVGNNLHWNETQILKRKEPDAKKNGGAVPPKGEPSHQKNTAMGEIFPSLETMEGRRSRPGPRIPPPKPRDKRRELKGPVWRKTQAQ